ARGPPPPGYRLPRVSQRRCRLRGRLHVVAAEPAPRWLPQRRGHDHAKRPRALPGSRPMTDLDEITSAPTASAPGTPPSGELAVAADAELNFVAGEWRAPRGTRGGGQYNPSRR